jgi:hypothetical protein
METRFCTLCRNHCSLDHPKCPEVLTDEMLAQRAAQEDSAGDCCQLCGNHCPYTALRCETGKTMARIKGKLPAAE